MAHDLLFRRSMADGFDMIARCARRQNPIARRQHVPSEILRYEVRTGEDDDIASSYADLPSALAMANELIEIGYRVVLVYDLHASPGQPELWMWETRANGSGQWRVRVKGGGFVPIEGRSLRAQEGNV